MGAYRSAVLGWVVCGLVVAVWFALVPGLAAAANPLHVIPFPGTPDASPLSRVIFSSLAPTDIQSVTVTGTVSGTHTGNLVQLPDGAGTAFVPDQPFADGEQVNVTANLTSPAAGTASGDPNATTLTFSFTIAVPPSGSPNRPPPGRRHGSAASPRARTTSSGSSPVQTFHSQRDLGPPAVTSQPDSDRSSGDIFLTAHTPPPTGALQNGPMILDGEGHLVWFRPVNGYATNLQVQRYESQPVLTWFQQIPGSGNEDVIVNSSYQTVATVRAGYGYVADLHEFQLTPRGTALIDAYVPVVVGGPSTSPAVDCVVQELDVKTGQVLWEWHTLGHVPIAATYSPPPNSPSVPYDFFHLNSIQELPNGNLIISARNTWAVYEIDKQTGDVIWSLGGKSSSFHMGAGTNFEWQHDAQLSGNTLSLFDDGGLPQEESQSSAKVLVLDTGRMTVSLVKRYTHSPPVLTGFEGNTQVLPNHDVFVGWGNDPDFSEYTPAGKQIFSGSLPLGTNSYRAYRFPWTGHPLTRPSLAIVSQNNGTARVYASWNGATQVASWRVLGGPTPSGLDSLARESRTGFETTIVLGSEPSFVAVQALDASGKVLGASVATPDPPHLSLFLRHAFVSARNGYGVLAVGCFTGSDCQISTRVSIGATVLAQTGPLAMTSRTGTEVVFRLSAAGQNMLRNASTHQLSALVTVHDAVSGGTVARAITLIDYTGEGPPRPLAVSQSSTIQLEGGTGFVSPAGRGVLLTACYGNQVCVPRGTITSGGVVIGTIARTLVGAEELGQVKLTLNKTGQALLAKASAKPPGARLRAEVRLTNGASVAAGTIALVRYG